MHKIKYIFLLLVMTSTFLGGTIHAQDRRTLPWSNGKLQVSQNGRFLQHENGTPFFWLGETAWLLSSRLNRDEVGYYIGETAKNGYNVIQVSVLHSQGEMNTYGHWALPKRFNFDGIDRDGEYNYWKHVDYIVQTAASRGIYIGIVCAWSGSARTNMTVEEARKYGEFLGNRYKNHPNIIWIIGGDVRGDAAPDQYRAIANAIRTIVGKDHLMTYHPLGRTMSATWFHNEPWLDFNMFQSGHRRYGQQFGDGDYPIEPYTEEDSWRFVESSLAYKPAKPVLDGEPSYEDIPHGLRDVNGPRWQAPDVRRYAYWSVFAGSCGHTYGHNSTMQMMRPGVAPSFAAKKPWWEAVHDPGCQQMKHLKTLMLAFPYFERIPDQSVIAGTNGIQHERIIATRGNDYILIYNYTNRRMEIDMTKISGTKKKAWWYSPVTGQAEYIGEFANGKQTFNRDSAYGAGNDWVLIITDAKVNYAENNLTAR